MRKFFAILLLSTLAIAGDEKITVTTTDGKTYEGKVTRVEKSGIVLMHSGGIARIDFEKLPEDIQEKFGYDPTAASAERQAMIQAQAQRNQAAAAQRAAAEERLAKAKLMESAKKQTYKVLSVITGEGILAYEYRRGGPAGRMASAISSISGGRSSTYIEPSTGDLVFLSGKISTVVDDDILEAMIVPDGTYQYTTVEGSVSTVKKFQVLDSKVDE